MIAAMARRISSPIIVGRTEELEALLAAAERGVAGETETVVVRGEAGIGKSRLVLELGVEASSRGFELVVGGCPALVDSPLPFAPIVAATEAILRSRDTSAAHALLDGIGPDLVRIAPALGARLASPTRRRSPRASSRVACLTRSGPCSSGPPRFARSWSCTRTSTGRTLRRST